MRLLRTPMALAGAHLAARRMADPHRSPLGAGAKPLATGTWTWLRQRVRLGLPLAVAYVWLATPTPRSLALGTGVALLGLVLRGTAASSLRKHEALVTSGPYAFTRHPLYLGSVLMAGGFLMAAHSWSAAVLVATYLALFYPGAMKREERKLRARYGRSFQEYAARVPMFLPRLISLRSAHFSPSWALYRRNGEHQTALGLGVGVAVLWLKCAP